MRILVISPCSKEQIPEIPNKLQPIDFSSCNRLAKGMERLKDYKTPAAEMYEGREHKKIMRGLRKIRRCYGRESVDLSIISTGYGLVCESRCIVPYDVDPDKSLVLKRSEKLHTDIEKLIKNYDLVFFLLGRKYCNGLKLHKRPFDVPNTVTQIFLIFTRTTGYRNLIPEYLPNCDAVELNSNEFRDTYTAKGLVFNRLCEAACREGFHVFEQVKEDPQRLLEIVRR